MDDNTMTSPTRDEITHWFEHGKVFTAEQGQRLTDLHAKARELALAFYDTLPRDRPETEQALLKVQEAVQWANTAISRE